MRLLVALLSICAATSPPQSPAGTFRPPVEACHPAPKPDIADAIYRSALNRAVADEIGSRLRAIRLRHYDIFVVARNGRVVLTGYVGSASDRDRAERITKGSLGVREVDNRLTIVPAPLVAEKPERRPL